MSIYQRIVERPFEHVLEDIEFAITERNFRIIQRLEIGHGLQQRGHTDFPLTTLILFCNLDYARRLLLVAPQMVNTCPYRASVRMADVGVVIAIPLLKEFPKWEINHLIVKLNDLFQEIVDYAVTEDLSISVQ